MSQGLALQWVSPTLRNDKELVVVAINQNAAAFAFASLELQADDNLYSIFRTVSTPEGGATDSVTATTHLKSEEMRTSDLAESLYSEWYIQNLNDLGLLAVSAQVSQRWRGFVDGRREDIGVAPPSTMTVCTDAMHGGRLG